MKKYLSIFVGLVMVFSAAPVFAINDVTLDTNAQIVIGSETFLITAPQQTADSITVNATNFTVTLAPGVHFKVSAASRNIINVSYSNSISAVRTCNSTISAVELINTGGGSATVTVTPGTALCTDPSQFFGGGYSAPAVPSAALNLAATAGNAQVALSWQAPSTDGNSTISNYKVYRGSSSGGEVLLATLGNILTYTDIGLTNETAYYYKVSAVNAIGEGDLSAEISATPVTPAPSAWSIPTYSIPAVSAPAAAAPAVSAPATPAAPAAQAPAVSAAPAAAAVSVSAWKFKTPLELSSTGTDVTKLQQRLTAEGVYSGPITGYFGPLTQAAVKKYQEQKGLATAGQAGYGNVGPATRAALNSSAAAQPAAPSAAVSPAAATQTVSALQAQLQVLQAKLLELLNQQLQGLKQ